MRHTPVNLSSFSLLLLVFTSLRRALALATSIPHGTVDLIAESQWIVPGNQTYIGLNFQLDRGWNIYWVTTGDSGQPPRVEWHLPTGLSAGELEWPAPRRLGTSTIVDYGYDNAVMLLVPLRASSSLPINQAAQLDAELRVLVCREICIPGKAQVSLTIAIKSMPPEPDARTSDLFTFARKSLPRRAPADWEFHASSQKDSFMLIAKLGRQITQATFFPLEESQVDNSAPQKIVAVAIGFQLTLRKSDQLLKPIKRLKGVLELSANQSYLIDAIVGETQSAR